MHRLLLPCLVIACVVGSSCSKTNDNKPNGNAANSSASEQNSPSLALRLDSTKYFFEGTLGDKSRVNAELSLTSTAIDGRYRYYAGSRALSLSGTVQADLTVQMTERDNLGRGGWSEDENQTTSGRFIGKLDKEKGTISGTWTSKDGKKSLPFFLQAVGNFAMLKDSKLDVSVDYPIFAQPHFAAVNDTLSTIAKRTFKESYATVDTTRKEYEQEPEFKERAAMISEHSSTNIEFASDKLVSLSILSDSYMGGAHGMYGYDGLTWKMTNGVPTRFKLTDVFREDTDFRAQISNLLINKLKKESASSVVDGSITSFVDELRNETLAYTVHPSGLTFYFNPYHVASYAEGAFEIHIPWKSLQSVLREDALKQFFPAP